MKRILCILIPGMILAVQPELLSRQPIIPEINRFDSPQGEFSARFEYGRGNSEFVPIQRFTLLDKAGQAVYSKADYQHTLADLADNGVVVGIDFDGPISGRARLHFYDRLGRELSTAEIGFLNERAFSANSEAYCVNDGKQGVRVFDVQGREKYNLGSANWFAIAPDGRTVAVARDAEIVLYADGRETGRIALASPFVRKMRFSPDGSRFGFVDRKLLAVYRTIDLTRLFEYRENQAELNFISLAFAPDNLLVAATQDEDAGRGAPARHTSGRVSLFDAGGQSVWTGRLSYELWNNHVPEVDFRADRSFRVRTAEAVLEYRH